MEIRAKDEGQGVNKLLKEQSKLIRIKCFTRKETRQKYQKFTIIYQENGAFLVVYKFYYG